MPSKPPAGTVLNPVCIGEPATTVEYFFLLCCCVAGKGALRQQTCLDVFLSLVEQGTKHGTPFERLHTCWVQAGRPLPELGADAARLCENFAITEMLKQSRMGQYTRLTRLLCWLLHSWEKEPGMLQHWDRAQFITIPGVGLKTSSFFLLNSRADQSVAVLDTHVLAYMRERKLHTRVPAATPGDLSLYMELEGVWLQHCRESGYSPQ